MTDETTIDWVKPNGNEITTNAEPATIKYCVGLGWVNEVSDESALDEEAVGSMSKADLVGLIVEYGLDVDKSAKVAVLRTEVAEALFSSENDD